MRDDDFSESTTKKGIKLKMYFMYTLVKLFVILYYRVLTPTPVDIKEYIYVITVSNTFCCRYLICSQLV